ncbi:cytochrome P450 sterol C22-desaturase [Cylindrobasidium torrendii FP15055 ss-10]|uniref:Cytochrome P450 sterol C22-desaturase n=1 Tax=Cylindrobasidium torrendii FP15055 ss-10 TaxID=1314674 RepID=A0A0D7BD64_9AGAR|nr:cytochrome P450 sterol C22-desaturase [Cylindrobasidium torrendii FP15055 ss-10]
MNSTTAPASASPLPSFMPFTPATTSWLYTTGAILFTLLALEQAVYRYKKRHLPGSSWTIPIIGKFADSLNPTMEGYKAQWNSGPLSAISVFNIFIVMASTTEHARKILNSPTYAEPCLVQSAKQVLLKENWVFLTGKDHVDYRRSLNSLFTRKALGMYTEIQDRIIRKHYKNWLETAAKDASPKPIMTVARYLNMDTSLRVFCGYYIPDEATKIISDKYYDITAALELVNFPLALPGTKIYKAIQCRKEAMYWLTLAAKKSKEAMARGDESSCMLDEWIRNISDPSWKGKKEFSDHEMAMVVLSFLFASQDAMSSGLIYAFQHLADSPEMFAKVREEQDRVRGGDMDAPITLEMLDSMTYLQAFVKESLRVMPPVVMVPYTATKPFPISENYTVPANSMIIPSFYNALHDPEVYPRPDDLKPERWLDPKDPANTTPKNYLVFGAGPHKCIGIEYALMNMTLSLAIAVGAMDWKHDITPLSYKVQIMATLFPQDHCRLAFTPRKD